MIREDRHALIFFVDGVGMGINDPETNPFIEAALPCLTGMLGDRWYLRPDSGGPGRISREQISLVPTDPNMNMPGRPQSATGQATILTGQNVPMIVGEHYGPKPNPAVFEVINKSNLFQEVIEAGGTASLITPYPQGYFDGIDSGKRLLSSVPLAAVSAGLSLMTADDLRAGRAVSPGFTGQGWHDFLGYTDIPIQSLSEAGMSIARIANDYSFTFFEHWPSDRSGHRGSIDQASRHLEIIDEAIGGLFDGWNNENGLLIITSDHGNIEEKDHRRHSRNPVPTILYGRDQAILAARINDLADIAGVIRDFLGIDFG
jgi:2,3-bisphosphoglycerate-independent phosphoglycerate mutase